MVWGQSAARGIDDLVDRIARNDPKLSSLHIMKQRKFGAQEATKLFDALATNTTLTELYCSGHVMSSATTRELSEVLTRNTTLQSLCVGDSSFGDEELVALVPGLIAAASLHKLDLENKALSAVGVAALGSALEGGAALQHVVLSRNTFSDAGVLALAVGSWGKLRHLDLTDCGITHQGVSGLTHTSMPQLTSLILSSNPLGPRGGEAVGKLLSSAPQLQQLRLLNTELGDEGVASLSSHLPDCSSMVELDVGGCNAGGTAGAALAVALQTEGCRLQRLLLGGSEQLTAASVGDLAAALCSPSCPLTSLDISRAKVSLPALSALSRSPCLQTLSLLGCSTLSLMQSAELVDCLCGPTSFPHLQELNIAGCGLQLPAVSALLQRIREQPAALPQLKVLAIGANEATEHDELEQVVGSCQESRPDLHLHWRSGDGIQDEGGSQ